MYRTDLCLSPKIRALGGILFCTFLLFAHSPLLAASTLQVVKAANHEVTSGATSMVSISIAAGDLAVVWCSESINNTSVASISDSSGGKNVWTQTSSGYVSVSPTAHGAMFYSSLAVPLTSVTCTWSGGINGRVQTVVYDISGAASSGIEDSSVSSTNTNNVTDLFSNASGKTLTTTNANDILLFGIRVTANQTSFASGTNYAIQPGASGIRSTMSYRIVSSTQSAMSTDISYPTAAINGQGIYAAFKAAAGTGGTAPSITSLSPSSGTVGATVVIAGSNFGASQGTSTVTFNGTVATPTSWSDTSITVPVPSGATSGNVIVNVGGVASNPVAFTVIVPPSITSVSPTFAPLGASVTITGSNFGASQGTSTVTFNGVSATPTSWSPTSIVTTVPNGATSGNVVVTVSGLASNGIFFRVAPYITSLSPMSGPIGTFITIAGTSFGATQGTSSVTLGPSTLTPTSWNDAVIFAPVPAGATTGNLIVMVNGVGSNRVLFTVTPAMTSLSPASGPVGTSVTITGTSFGASQGTSTVTFNGTAATPTSWSDTGIVVPVPTGATTGNVFIAVGGFASNPALFTVLTPPSITGLSPTSGPVGTSVTIAGTNFGPSQGSSTVTFNSTPATPTSWNPTSIVVPVPAGATSGNVIVTASGFASNGVNFTVTPPTITSLSPSSAVVGGAPLTLTVNGTNFASSSTVQWNGNALATTFISSTQLRASVTSANIASVGAAKVTVSNASVGGGVSNTATFFVGTTGIGGYFATILVNQAAQDIVYDSKNQVFYLSVPATSSTYPNTIAVLDPAAATITFTQPTGNNPNVLAISDDSQFLYAGIDGVGSVQRFILPGLAPDISYPLGSNYFGPNTALDLQVAPGTPRTTAVTLGEVGNAAGGVIIFDDATPRPTSAPGTYQLFDSIQWGSDSTTLFASNTQSTGFDFYTFAVNSSGVTLSNDFQSTFTHFGANIHFSPGTNLVYSDDGHAINPTTGLPFGNFNITGAMTVDATLNTAFFAGPGAIESFDLLHFTPIFTVPVPGVSGTPSHLIRWSQNGLAFINRNSNGTSQIVLLGGDVVTAASPFAVTPPSAPVLPPVPAPNAPTVASLNPSSAIAGSGAFVLNVIGTQFDPAATVQFNGAALSTTYVSSNQLQALIPASSVAIPGTASVVVANPPASGGNSSGAAFFVGSTGGTSSAGTGYAVQIVNQPSNRIAFDPVSQRLYLSVPNSVATGNTIAVLNPATATIVGEQFAGSNPNALTISDDGQFLYAGIDGSSTVQRFTLPGLGTDIAYALGAGPNYYIGPYFALDLQAAPGSPHTTAVTLGAWNSSPAALGGIEIFDDATPRQTTALGFGPGGGGAVIYDSLQWGADATSVFAANNEGSGFDFYNLSVTPSGVSLTSDFPGTFSRFHNAIHFDRGTNLVYSDDGHVVVPSTGASAGTFPTTGLTSAVMVPDSSLNLAFFAAKAGYATMAIYSYNLSTFAPVSSITIPNVNGNPIRLIRWGQNGLAFNTDAGQIVLVGGNFVY